MSKPVRAEWASGRRKFSLALLMFWLGGAWLAVSLIIGLQAMAVPAMAKDLGKSLLLVPAWALVTIFLAFALRRSPKRRSLAVFSATWLVVGFTVLAWAVQGHA